MTEVLKLSLEHIHVDSPDAVVQFSRWARMLIMLLLPIRPENALDIVRAGRDVKLGEHGRHYPDTEVSWLFAIAWQQGQECMRQVLLFLAIKDFISGIGANSTARMRTGWVVTGSVLPWSLCRSTCRC